MVSCGEKLTGGRVLAPVTKARIAPASVFPLKVMEKQNSQKLH